MEKKLFSLNPLSFERIKGYLFRMKEIQLKLGECGKEFPKNDDKLIDLILMNLKTLYDVFCSTFHVSWDSIKMDGKDYIIDFLCGFLIGAHVNLLNEGKLENKHMSSHDQRST